MFAFEFWIFIFLCNTLAFDRTIGTTANCDIIIIIIFFVIYRSVNEIYMYVQLTLHAPNFINSGQSI